MDQANIVSGGATVHTSLKQNVSVFYADYWFISTDHVVADRRSQLKLFEVQPYLKIEKLWKMTWQECKCDLAYVGGYLVEGVGAGGVRADGVGPRVAGVL